MSLRAWLLKSDYLYLRVELVGLEEPKAGAGVWRGGGGYTKQSNCFRFLGAQVV